MEIYSSLAVNSQITNRLTEFITNEMKGSDMKLVIQKTLQRSDISRDYNALSMPINQLETQEFLTAYEKRCLENHGQLEVRLLGPTLQAYEKPMMLARWFLKNGMYVLKTNWYGFVEKSNGRNLMMENTEVQVWSFRRDGQLWFAIACVEPEPIAARNLLAVMDRAWRIR